jgi:FkbM family methyltransferase
MSRFSKFYRTTRAFAAWQALSTIQRPDDIYMTRTPNGWMATFAGDKVIGDAIRRHGHFEEADVATAMHLLKTDTVKRGTFIDIGANIGTHGLFALQSGFKRCVSIEPDDQNFKLLKLNQVLNDRDQQCINLQCAISNQTGEVQLHLSSTNYGDHQLASGKVETNALNQQSQTKTIKTIAFDEIFNVTGTDPNDVGLVWIDTQGHEGSVLSNASTLKSHSIPAVIEFWPHGLARSGGYNQLRSFVSQGVSLSYVRQHEVAGTVCTLDTLDAYYEAHKASESVHTDIMVIPD